MLPASVTLSNGSATFSAAFATAGSPNLTLADRTIPTLSGTSGGISVTASAPQPTTTTTVASTTGTTTSHVPVNHAALKVTITRQGPARTKAHTLHFHVTFSAAVTGVNAKAFKVTTSPALRGAHVTAVERLSGSSYVVTVAVGAGKGKVRLDLAAGISLTDAAGDSLHGGFTGGQSFIKTA